MDVWVVAAAAGAGLVVQRLKNLNFVRPEVSSSQDDQDSSCPFRRLLLRKRSNNEMTKEREIVSEVYSTEDICSTSLSEGHNFLMPDNFRSCSSVSDTNSLSGFLNHEDFGDCLENRMPPESEEVLTSDSMPQPSSVEVGISYGFRRNRSSIRSRRTHSHAIIPRTSLESCVMAQLYKGPGEFEETIYSSDQLQRPDVRPFVVSDGSRIISRLPNESFSAQTEMGKYKLPNDTSVMENKDVLGIPELPDIVHEDSQRKAKTWKRKKHILRNGSRENESKNLAGDGLRDKGLHFFCGLTVGIISACLANKIEMENLHKLLKQNENLVQDLQEELEMKDSLTVKELPTEQHYESHDAHSDLHSGDAAQASYHEREEDNRSSTPEHKFEEESLSRIEAELEAELERLESTMNSSRLDGKLSNVVELDPDSIPDVVEGELRADLFEAKNGEQPYADRDGSGTTTPCSLPQPVSPRELTLRLHELIQSRLEHRVKELELALENSQRMLKMLESSTAQNSPIIKNGQQHQHVLDQPVVINLSGEALSAYNEAYEELAKVSESDGEDPLVEFELNGGVSGNGDDVRTSGPDSGWVSNGNRDTVTYGGSDDDSFPRLNDNLSGSMEESDDELERLLIRQVIEKAKQGSPAVLKAQRAFLLTEN